MLRDGGAGIGSCGEVLTSRQMLLRSLLSSGPPLVWWVRSQRSAFERDEAKPKAVGSELCCLRRCFDVALAGALVWPQEHQGTSVCAPAETWHAWAAASSVPSPEDKWPQHTRHGVETTSVGLSCRILSSSLHQQLAWSCGSRNGFPHAADPSTEHTAAPLQAGSQQEQGFGLKKGHRSQAKPRLGQPTVT